MNTIRHATQEHLSADEREHVQVLETIRAGAAYLFALQRADHHWCAELESNPTVTAEYIFMCQALGLDLQRQRDGLSRWLLSWQKEDGSFGVAINSAGDVSTTCEVYLALRLLALDLSHPALQRARAAILARGGMARVRIFTRIFFAMFGLFDWRDVPAMPPEFIFLPAWCPLNIYSLASWARGTMVPLLILAHHRPVFALPNGRQANNPFTDELWTNPANKRVPYLPSWPTLLKRHGALSWTMWFSLADTVLKLYERMHIKPVRRKALQQCTAWILERQEPSGDWAGIFPPMLNNLLALPLQGHDLQSRPMRLGLAAMERFAVEDARGRRIQACVSPVWDTLLSLIGLCDAGYAGHDPRLTEAADWLASRQITRQRGDWAVYRPHAPPGGWSFEYNNTWYPDVDDTAAVLLALLKQDPRRATTPAVHTAVEWILGMQNRDGGWGAFDADNDKLFINKAPFMDMEALCDPSTSDVTGRVIEAFGLLYQKSSNDAQGDGLPPELRRRIKVAMRRAVVFVQKDQQSSGAWFGRWGVNYIYGTSHVLCGLSRVPWAAPTDTVAKAVAWLRSVQNGDGGWGECIESYNDPDLAGHGLSTASQTAWALMALLAHVPPTDPAITAGIKWLVQHQRPQAASSGTWLEPETTATGFPGHFYVRYDLYRHYFPMMALGRYAQAMGLQNTQLRQFGRAQSIA